MIEFIDMQEQINAMNAAYKKAGHNAYFGNGFYAGIKFALERSKANEMFEMLKKLTEHYQDVLNGDFSNFSLRSDIDAANELIQQATTIK